MDALSRSLARTTPEGVVAIGVTDIPRVFSPAFSGTLSGICSAAHVVRKSVPAFEGHEYGGHPPCERHISEGRNSERRDDKSDRPEDFCSPSGSRPVRGTAAVVDRLNSVYR